MRDDQPEVVIVHHFPSDATATASAEQIELIAREGQILSQGRPVADFLVFESVTVDGPVVTSRCSYTENGSPQTAIQLWQNREPLMTFGGIPEDGTD